MLSLNFGFELMLSSYFVDGNVYFYIVVDISWWLEYLNSFKIIVVGIGYLLGKYVYDFWRGLDFILKVFEYDMFLDKYGNLWMDILFGEVDEFLSWI